MPRLKNARSIYVTDKEWDYWMSRKHAKVHMSLWIRAMIELALRSNWQLHPYLTAPGKYVFVEGMGGASANGTGRRMELIHGVEEPSLIMPWNDYDRMMQGEARRKSAKFEDL